VYNPNATDNATFIAPFVAGVSLLLVGFSRLGSSDRTSELKGSLEAGDTVPLGELPRKRSSTGLCRLFANLAITCVVVTLLAFAYMALNPTPGGMSGVPLALGLLMAGVFGALSAAAKE
jgi:hypothetical protein